MPQITITEIEKAYVLAKQVYFNEITRNDALDEAESYGLSRGSAHDMISNFRYMYDGQRYSRTNNHLTTEYYLKNILSDFGKERFKNALKALELHIPYYESLRKVTRQGERKILAKYTKLLTENEAIIYPDDIENNQDLFEGSKKQIIVNAYERSSQARQECIEHYGTKCSICNFDFEKVYGDIGKGFIHVHHIKPLSEIDEKYKINPIEDLRPVCPNCHAMLHKRKPAYSIEEIKDKINK